MRIVVFEDGLHDNFYPLSLTRPVWELRSGLWSFRERFEAFFAGHPRAEGNGIWYFTRDYLAPHFRERLPGAHINDMAVFSEPGEILFVNAALYPSESLLELGPNSALMRGPTLLAARLDSPPSADSGASLAEAVASIVLTREDVGPSGKNAQCRAPRYIWEMVDWNGETLTDDIALAGMQRVPPGLESVTIAGDRGQVHIGEGAVIEPFVYLDASSGPIVIAPGALVQSGSRIDGPCVIGTGSRILGARVRGGTSIGEDCRMGGEVDHSIFYGHVNKYHDGFIGHSCVGEWVNLGALTTNSDLKNDYSNIKVYTPTSRKKTGLRKTGCFIGDFVKTSIGTLINTGTSIGPGAMLVHAGRLTPFHIPSFAWYMDGAVARPDWRDDFLAVCREAMARRNVELTGALIGLLDAVYEMTVGGT